MAQDQIEEVKEKTDIVALISEYVSLKKSGRHFKGLCPFHSERTPSFMVSPELQIFKCFGCQVGGDCLTFVQEYEKVEFPEALKILADRAGVKLHPLTGFAGFNEKEEIYKVNFAAAQLYHYILMSHPEGEDARTYLKKRGIKPETAKEFNLGFAPDKPNIAGNYLIKKKGYTSDLLRKAALIGKKERGYYDFFRGRIIFPLEDHYGKILGFSGRLVREKEGVGKYINSPETRAYTKGKTLYGLAHTKQEIKKQGVAIAVEGELDLLSSWQAGVKNLVAIKGSAFTEDQATLLARFCPTVYLALDSDFAGDQAAQRGITVLQNEGLGIRVVELTDYKDPDQAAQSDPQAWQEAVKHAENIYDYLIKKAFKEYNSETTEGKANISRTLAPILASIPDAIIKNACIKKVAQRLNVSEEAVITQAAKFKKPDISSTDHTNSNQKEAKGRRELLEEYLLQLALQHDPKRILEKDFISIFKTPLAQKLVERLKLWQEKHQTEEFNAGKFGKNLPPELLDFASTLLLAEIGKIESLESEIKKTLKSVNVMEIKNQMAQITLQIKEAEEKGDAKALNDLEKKLIKTGNKLAVTEASW